MVSKGDVVGGGQTADGKDHAFLYSKGKVTDLGTAPGFEGSAVNAINAGGEVVGSLYLAAAATVPSTTGTGD